MGRPRLRNNDPMIGTRVYRWIIISYNGVQNGNVYLKCRCNCGTIKSVLKLSLQKSMSKSCGCYNKEQSHKAHFKNSFVNHKNRDQRRFYQVWHNMKYRCSNSKHPSYKYYGARGISVCSVWKIFDVFKNDMYPSYLIHCQKYGTRQTTIDRINNNLGYTAKNCRWAIPKEQNQNKRKP